MDVLFGASSNFVSLSLKDLMEARDQFHYHLMNKKNVVATAIGLYRIRKDEPWPNELRTKEYKHDSRRTLFNSEIRQYSWPCVYVFVSSWEYETKLADTDPVDVVPKTLYLADGRSVPVCVIEALQQEFSKDLEIGRDFRAPRNLLGPGTPIINEHGQGMARMATAGALVRDGESYYVLTNRHAVGETGTIIRALQGHRGPEIGTTAPKGLTRKEFAKVYPAFPSRNQRLLMDVGLIELDDVFAWKTDVPGIDPVGPVLDLYDNSFSLKLISMKVVGQAAVSGAIRGEIHALFYRYKAMGGWEYVSDFLIGPETYGNVPALKAKEEEEKRDQNKNITLPVHHGDSGTVLYIEHPIEQKDAKPKEPTKFIYYPFALLWGKEEFFDDGEITTHPYALATSLSTALDHLDLDLVRNINLDQEYVWGWVGHYIIGRDLGVPVDLLSSPDLQAFIKTNIDILAIQPDMATENDPKVLAKGDSEAHFVPLADVPDNVWKSNVNFSMGPPGDDGKKKRTPGPGSRGRDDNPNHFADLDLVYEKDKTFLELNDEDPDTYLNPEAWVAYFDAMKPKYEEWAKLMKTPFTGVKAHWGALPFRVHQLFDAMVDAAKKGQPNRFLLAGGVLIHYVGDACQPLHASYLSQGNPDKVLPRPRSPKMKLQADGVHSGYEDDMIGYGEANEKLSIKLATRIAKLADEDMPVIRTGYDASKAIITLIKKTHEDIEPSEIVDTWVKVLKKSKAERAPAMWDVFGDRTITVMARGTRYLAALWQAAWTAGDGDTRIGKGRPVTKQELMTLYNDPKIVPSIPLDHYPSDAKADWSQIEPVAHTEGPAKQAKKKKAAASGNRAKGKKTAKRAKKKK
jgi:hypothetical protein